MTIKIIFNSIRAYWICFSFISCLVIFSSNGSAEDNHLFTGQTLSLEEALIFTKHKQPNIQFQQQLISFAKGEHQVESGEFDPRISGLIERARRREGLFADESSLDFEVKLDKRFRSGQEIRLAGVLEHKKAGQDKLGKDDLLESDDNGDDEDETEDVFNSPDPPLSESSASVYLELIQPLLRNRGKDASGAQEKAAQMVVKAREIELRDKVSKSLLDTTLAYWDYVATKKILDLRKEVANTFRQDVNDMRNIQSQDEDEDEDEGDIVDTEEAEAELFTRDTALTQAELVFFKAKNELGLAMGLVAYSDIRDLPEPEYTFASISASERKNIHSFMPLYREKMRQRRDAVLVLAQLEKSVEVQVHAAKRNLQPRLDLIARVGYTGSDQGKSSTKSFTAFGSHTRGLNWIVGGQFSYPIGNNRAKGVLRQEQATLADLEIQRFDLIRTVDSNIATLVEELFSSSVEIELTNNTIKLFKKALDRQKHDFNEEPDLGKLIDLISVENDWIDARLEKIEQELSHASAIASLAYETGDVLEPGSGYKIKAKSLTRIPDVSIFGNN